MKSLPNKMKVFLISIYIITIALLALFISENYIPILIADKTDIAFFAILVLITETFTVAFFDISVSTGFAVTLSSFILFGPLSTIIIIILGFSLRIVKVSYSDRDQKYVHIFNTPFYKTLFNYCNFALPVLIGGAIYYKAGGELPLVNIRDNIIPHISNNIFPLMIFVTSFFVINTFIISILVSTLNNKNLINVLFKNLRLGVLNILAMTPFGIVLAAIFIPYTYFGVILFLSPILLARYSFSLYIEAKNRYIRTVDILMNAMEARDKYTEGHSRRVASIAEQIAKVFNYNDNKIERLKIASLLHDVGKIGVDDNILNKPGKLTEDEYNIIKQHPVIGHDILKNIKDLEDINVIVKHHHERYDGKGYPGGKSPEELNLDVFIVQLADSIDAMETDRPYRKAMTKSQVVEEIRKNSGTQFHPAVVNAYISSLEK